MDSECLRRQRLTDYIHIIETLWSSGVVHILARARVVEDHTQSRG
jgi:hypothetical protein